VIILLGLASAGVLMILIAAGAAVLNAGEYMG